MKTVNLLTMNCLIDHPCIIVIPILIISGILLTITICLTSMPTFNDPALGFETRKTEISTKLYTLNKLLLHTSNIEHLVDIDKEDNESQEEIYYNDLNYKHYENIEFLDHEFDNNCNLPDSVSSKVIFKSMNDNSLFSLENLKIMCLEEQSLISFVDCKSNKEKALTVFDCCPIRSLPNTLALFQNLSSCNELSQEGIDEMLHLFDICVLNGTFINYDNCQLNNHRKICQALILKCNINKKYLLDVAHFIDNNYLKKKSLKLNYVISYLPYLTGKFSKDLFNRLKIKNINKSVKIIGADFGLIIDEFEEQLLFQLVYALPSMICVLIIIFLYTESLIVMILNILQLFCTFVITFFIYRMIFCIAYFPFINMLTLFILIAIGLDGTFVAFHYWSCEKSKLNVLLPDALIKRTCYQSLKSIFAASITTATAFFSAYFFNGIPMLKSFAIFSGTSLLINFVISCAFIPAMTILSGRCQFLTCCKCQKEVQCFKFNQFLHIVPLHNIIARLIYTFKIVFIVLFFILLVISFVVIFVTPKLKASNTNDMQLMHDSHLFEAYKHIIQDQFIQKNLLLDSYSNLPVIVVFGVKPYDDRGFFELSVENNFNEYPNYQNINISSTEVQLFLANFCRKLRKFNLLNYGNQETNALSPKYNECFLETFKLLMRRECPKDKEHICCNVTNFPYPPYLFEYCLENLAPLLAELLYLPGQNNVGGFRYMSGRHPKAFIITMQGPVFNRTVFNEIDDFYEKFNKFVMYEASEIPDGLRSVWFITDDRIKFFDLQKNLLHSIPFSVLLSLCSSLIITFIFTLNPVATLIVGLTVISSVAETIAIVTLLGWKLNIVESATIIVTNGFALDFILHYTIAFIQNYSSNSSDKFMQLRTMTITGPVTTAALCSIIAGAFLLLTNIQVYHQIGIFILVVTIIGWLNATFFLMPMLVFCGDRLVKCNLKRVGNKKIQILRTDNRDSMGIKHVYRFANAATPGIHERHGEEKNTPATQNIELNNNK